MQDAAAALLHATADDPWLVRTPGRDQARLRLFCFPYAGGGPSAFRTWSQGLPPEIDVIAVRPPGRDRRVREPAHADWTALLDACADALAPHIERPFAFFGHSFGARLSYELTRRFQDAGLPLPVRVFISGCRCPHIPSPRPLMHDLPRPSFLERVRNMEGTPPEILASPTLMKMLEPTLRADMKLAELWPREPARALQAPISAFCGRMDSIDPPEHMREWGRYTDASFDFHVFEGSHFFLHTEEAAVLDRIAALCATGAESA